MSYQPLAAEIDAMRAENARLKRVLREIAEASAHPLWRLDPPGMIKSMGETARAALGEEAGR